jgi:hypothetical protein
VTDISVLIELVLIDPVALVIVERALVVCVNTVIAPVELVIVAHAVPPLPYGPEQRD